VARKLELWKEFKMEKEISGVIITIDGTDYVYEAHSYDKVAEIIAAQMHTLTSMSMNEENPRSARKRIEKFEIGYFNS
jgi:hypothetical protein